MPSGTVGQRVHDTLTARAERRLLSALCRAMPGWVTSDMLTLFGVAGAASAFAGYWLSHHGEAWLWLAASGIVANWLGDSLDGTLARHRQAERPRYGFFLDHMSDTLAIGLIALGIGLSPYARAESGLAVLAGYYLMVILAMVTCIVTGVFRIGFHGVGPTEIRLLIVAFTVSGIFWDAPSFAVAGYVLSLYDAVMAAVTVMLVLTCCGQALGIVRELAAGDPPRQ